MTKPYTTRGEVQIIGTVSAPWPAFTFAARAPFVAAHAAALQKMLHVVERAARAFKEGGSVSVRRVSESFGLTEADAALWLAQTEYATEHAHVSRKALQGTLDALKRAQIVKSPPAPEDCVDEHVAHLTE